MDWKPPIRLLAIVPQIPDVSPGQRYRLEQWVPLLRQLGVDTCVEPFENPELNRILYQPGRLLRKVKLIGDAFLRRVRLLNLIPDYDIVYIFREATLLGPALIERQIHRLGVPIVFDFDDAIFVRYISPSNGIFSLLKCAGKTRTLCRIATHVMAGNRHLAEYAMRFNKNTTIIPTTIDTDKYRPEPPRTRPSQAVIGWTGSYSTVQHLDLLREALRKLARTENFRLRVIGPDKFEFPGVPTESIPWRSCSEVADLRPIDIGIMPLPDNRWTRGKCACKALQYMGLGIPTVCSPVGVNSEIIEDGVNGFLAAGQDEWIEKLTRLLRSADLRTRIGLAGRAVVEDRFSARVQAPKVFEVFRSAVQGRTPARNTR
jgi:glycosyltransferase involved in cell wall biosynthesis